jgi:hypothetical protein
VSNTGKPAGAFGDVGAFEYDDGMTPITVAFGYNTLAVSWTGLGRYGNASWQPVWYEVYVDGVRKAHRDPPAPPGPNAWPGYITEIVSASPCQSHDVWVMTQDEYGDTVYTTNVVTGTTCCDYPCGIERPGRTAASQASEEADLPLALGWPGANPSRGSGTVTWSIPRAQAGVAYELALFDLAGRKIAVISRGTAGAGRFAQALPFRSGDGAVLPSGVFFLRLRVGAEILNRRVVLIR